MGLNVEDIPYIALKCFERVPDLQVAIQARKRPACRSSELLQRTGIVRCHDSSEPRNDWAAGTSGNA